MMIKRTLLLAICIAGFFFSGYSQLNKLELNEFQIDTSNITLSLKKILESPENYITGSFNNPTEYHVNFYPKLSDKKTIIELDSNKLNYGLLPYNDMPCVNPKGSIPIPTHIPDSTVKYSMLIKPNIDY